VRQIEINPQEVMMLTEQMLQDGWIKGAEKGHGVIDDGGTRHPDLSGVCVVGALRQSLSDVLRPQITLMLQELPEYRALQYATRHIFLNQMITGATHSLLQIFRSRIETVLGSGIEGWNDTSSRKKQEVIEAMKASLEIITTECLEVWNTERPALQADAVSILKGA